MHDRVDHRLEDRAFAELGHVDTRRILVRRDPPIADHETHRLANLLVERAGNVPGVELPAGVHAVAAVAHGLDPGVRQPFPRVVRRQQHAADRRPQRTVPVTLQEFQLRQGDLSRFVRARADVLAPQHRAQAADPGVPHDLGVRRRRVGLPPRLRQPADLRGVHPPLLVSPPAKVSAGRSVHRRAFRNLYDQRATRRRFRSPHSEDRGPDQASWNRNPAALFPDPLPRLWPRCPQRRIGRIVADLRRELFLPLARRASRRRLAQALEWLSCHLQNGGSPP